MSLVRVLFFLIINFSSQCFGFTLQGGNPDLQGGDLTPLPIDYDPTNCVVNIASALSDAVNLWNTAETSGLKLAVGSQVSRTVASVTGGAGVIANPTLVCDPNFTSNATLGSPNGNLFSGAGQFNLHGNRIFYGYVVLNADTGTAKITNISSLALSIAVAHEIGHMIGLGHSADGAALMYYNLTSKTKLNLSQDDIDGISYLYPRNELNGNPLGCGVIKKNQPPAPGFFICFFMLLLLPVALIFIIRNSYGKLANGKFHFS